MEENKDYGVQCAGKMVEKSTYTFLSDFIAGICIGIAFIIPGFSGGSVAVLFGKYERLINSVTNVFKKTKESLIDLIPIGMGITVGALSFMFPLGYFLNRFPLPTVSLFVGLTLGGIPSLWDKVKGNLGRRSFTMIFIPLFFAALMSFIPIGAEVDLLNLSVFGYLIFFFASAIGACALVIPGISGSMILLILGYYNSIIGLITDNLLRFENIGVCVTALSVCVMGIIVGFLIISNVMKRLLRLYPRSIYLVIIGFIIGSIPTVYVSTMKTFGMLGPTLDFINIPKAPIHYAVCMFLVTLGICASYNLSAIKNAEK